jgi:NAD(P)-dependent dehydrogenase (short-subunit alcohol dehydrogenase family)
MKDKLIRRGEEMMAQREPDIEFALILGASSGFGAATSLKLAKEGYHILGVHLDRKVTMPAVEELINKINSFNVQAHFFNINAADEEKRKETVTKIRQMVPEGNYINVLLHSLAFGTLKPFISSEREGVVTQANLAMTMDVMAHSLVYWVQELFFANLLGYGSRIFAMTSHGSELAVPYYGAVSAAKSALENHIRQLAMELGNIGATAVGLKAGVTNTPALQKIPGHQGMIDAALKKNPAERLTTPEDVAKVIYALSGSDAQWINGQIIGVDYGENVIDRTKI